MWQLTKEDWTHLGGPMGTEYTTIIWTKLFTTVKKAKEFAERDTRHKEPIKWEKRRDSWFSGDLLSHAYYIREVKVEA